MTGARLFGLGVGPGDPELITLKTVRILREVDLIAYPAPLEGDQSMARAIAAPYIPAGIEEYAIRISMNPQKSSPHHAYDEAEAVLGQHLAQDRSVAVLCEGDPFFYGSFMYLFTRMATRWPTEIVPGISSMMASAAQLGMPLAAKNDVVSVIPSTLPEETLTARLEGTDTAVMIKVGRHLPKVRRALKAAGLYEKARYIERATLTEQKISDLKDHTAETSPYFSMILAHRKGSATA